MPLYLCMLRRSCLHNSPCPRRSLENVDRPRTFRTMGFVWNTSKLAAVHFEAVNKMKSGTSAVMNWTPTLNQSSDAPHPETSALYNWSPASDRSPSAIQPDTSRVHGNDSADPGSSATEGTRNSTPLGFNAPVRKSKRKKKTPKKLKDSVRE